MLVRAIRVLRHLLAQHSFRKSVTLAPMCSCVFTLLCALAWTLTRILLYFQFGALYSETQIFATITGAGTSVTLTLVTLSWKQALNVAFRTEKEAQAAVVIRDKVLLAVAVITSSIVILVTFSYVDQGKSKFALITYVTHNLATVIVYSYVGFRLSRFLSVLADSGGSQQDYLLAKAYQRIHRCILQALSSMVMFYFSAGLFLLGSSNKESDRLSPAWYLSLGAAGLQLTSGLTMVAIVHYFDRSPQGSQRRSVQPKPTVKLTDHASMSNLPSAGRAATSSPRGSSASS
mmetsp:Transcript_25635/g.81587  ORF Transcript_25635/g.81587 Transcript_25635/m.81587 type:complete len:289 (-) Transcript_25635:98-964(-)